MTSGRTRTRTLVRVVVRTRLILWSSMATASRSHERLQLVLSHRPQTRSSIDATTKKEDTSVILFREEQHVCLVSLRVCLERISTTHNTRAHARQEKGGRRPQNLSSSLTQTRPARRQPTNIQQNSGMHSVAVPKSYNNTPDSYHNSQKINEKIS